MTQSELRFEMDFFQRYEINPRNQMNMQKYKIYLGVIHIVKIHSIL